MIVAGWFTSPLLSLVIAYFTYICLMKTVLKEKNEAVYERHLNTLDSPECRLAGVNLSHTSRSWISMRPEVYCVRVVFTIDCPISIVIPRNQFLNNFQKVTK